MPSLPWNRNIPTVTDAGTEDNNAPTVIRAGGAELAVCLRWQACSFAGAQKMGELRRLARGAKASGWLFRGVDVLGSDYFAYAPISLDKRLQGAPSAAIALAAWQQKMQRTDVLAILQIPDQPGMYWACCNETDDSDGYGAVLPAYSTDTIVDAQGAVKLAATLRDVNDELQLLVDDAADAELKASSPSINTSELNWEALVQNAGHAFPAVKHQGTKTVAILASVVGVSALSLLLVLFWPAGNKGPTPEELAQMQAQAIQQREQREMDDFLRQAWLVADPGQALVAIEYALALPAVLSGYKLQAFTCSGDAGCQSEWLSTRWSAPTDFYEHWVAAGGDVSLPVDGGRAFVTHTIKVVSEGDTSVDGYEVLSALTPQHEFIMDIVALRASLNSMYSTGWSINVQAPTMHPTLGRSGHPAAQLHQGMGHGIARASFDRQWMMREILPKLLAVGLRANTLRITQGANGARIELEAVYAIQELQK